MHLLVAKDCIAETLFADFSESDAVVVMTSNCYNNKSSEPVFNLFIFKLHPFKRRFWCLQW